MLDIIRPTTGKTTIFGLDCQKEGVQIRRRVGYIPGELCLCNLYFPNQRELLAEVIEHVVSRAIQEIEDQWVGQTEPLVRMWVLAQVFVKYHARISGILNQLRAGAVVNDDQSS